MIKEVVCVVVFERCSSYPGPYPEKDEVYEVDGIVQGIKNPDKNYYYLKGFDFVQPLGRVRFDINGFVDVTVLRDEIADALKANTPIKKIRVMPTEEELIHSYKYGSPDEWAKRLGSHILDTAGYMGLIDRYKLYKNK